MKSGLLGATALVFVLSASAAQAAVIFTSTWDDTGVATNSLSLTSLTSGGQTWTVQSGSNNIDLIDPVNPWGIVADNGTPFLDLGGTGGTNSETFFFTPFNTVVGKTYSMTVRFRGAMRGGLSDFGANLLPCCGGMVFASTVPSNQDWSTATTTFTATSTSTAAVLYNQTLTNLNIGTLVDTVQVSVVPEPSTWMMMILGFGLIASQLRRRHRDLIEA
jgi:hypothetical protein